MSSTTTTMIIRSIPKQLLQRRFICSHATLASSITTKSMTALYSGFDGACTTGSPVISPPSLLSSSSSSSQRRNKNDFCVYRNIRHFSSSPPPTNENNNKDNNKNNTQKENKEEEEEDKTATLISQNKLKLKKRIQGIQMNPNGYSHLILPDYVIEKTNKKTGDVSLVNVDRALGYFWMMKDLNESKNKPILTNASLIPSDQAQTLPSLKGCATLSSEDGQVVDLPTFVTRNNRSKDANAQCTLLTISYKDFGHKLLPSWTEPFKSTFLSSSSSRYEMIHLSIVEGFLFRLLKNPIKSSQKSSTSPELWDTTLCYFDENPEELAEFRDVLRMHNTLTGYVYLLDGLGRVRFVGSGGASEDDVEKLLEGAKELTPEPKKRVGGSGSGSGGGASGRVGRKIRKN